MHEQIKKISLAVMEKLKDADSLNLINDIRVKFLGKNGEVTALFKNLKSCPPDQRPKIGQLINDLRNQVELAIKEHENKVAEREKNKKLAQETLDITLSKKTRKVGALHPLNQVIEEISQIFIGLGFAVKDGPEIELDYYNFEALNIPADHPSRDEQDTFYINDNILLRTQTSAVQVRIMEKEAPPLRIICPGKVYRPDDDASHSPIFHQIEGLVIDKNITLCDLKALLDNFARSYFSSQTKTRLRPSYFPFTEPSVEVDLSCAICNGKGCSLCKGTGWIELLGAGIVNPRVLEYAGIDSKEYSGLAFGMGVERAAMIKYGIPDIRLFYENDYRFLKQYR
ncbi:MAG: phenylalanine--tRNA ligase subunit alpha [Bacillota bacterium]|jgi:phenylalanyl-tRNA synthetase alpha chain|nr:phenylalanine--tRNA ligase subunit alpha [Bacillota bacterium]HHU42850.1 phenylalanine--tRNA ligase subunit alpha [Clostridiales bacterium]